MECNICMEAQSDIVCHCGFGGCKECIRKSILTDIVEARCVNKKCGVSFSRKFLHTTFGNAWYKNDYIPFLKSVLIEREQALIIQTLPIVQGVKEHKARKAELATIINTIKTLESKLITRAAESIPAATMDELNLLINKHVPYAEYESSWAWEKTYPGYKAWVYSEKNAGRLLSSFKTYTKLSLEERQPFINIEVGWKRDHEQARQARSKLLRLKCNAKKKDPMCIQLASEIDALITRRNELRILVTLYIPGTGEIKKGFEYICKCPKTGCVGLVSKSNRKCAACDSKICKDCHELLVEDTNDENDEDTVEQTHVCNEDNVKSIKLLHSDTKPCPKCGTLIFRISGCNQMYCTECHIGWNWSTGAINTGVIHNPHALDYLRGRGLQRVVIDIPCGGMITHNHYLLFENVLKRVCDTTTLAVITSIWRITSEFNGSLPRMLIQEAEYTGTETVQSFNHLRFDYVSGLSTREQWEHRVYLRDRAVKRAQTKHGIAETFVTLCSERLRAVYDESLKCYNAGSTSQLNKKYIKRNRNTLAAFFKNVAEEFENIVQFINRTFADEMPLVLVGEVPQITYTREHGYSADYCNIR